MLAELVARRANLVLAAVAVVTGLLCAALFDFHTGALRLRVEASTASLLADGDQERAFYDAVRSRFGDDRSVVVALSVDDVFSPGSLERVRAVTASLQALPSVRSVLSLATAKEIRGVGGDVHIAPFDLSAARDPAGRAALRKAVLGNPLYGGSLVSKDGRVAAFVVRFADMTDEEYADRGVDDAVLAAARRAAGGAEIWMTGGSHVAVESARILLAETATLPLWMLAVLSVVLLLSFRTVRGVAVPLLTIAVAVSWTLGVVAAGGGVLNPITSLVPPILTTLGLSYAVHVVAAAGEVAEARPRAAPREVVGQALRDVAIPVALTGLTTAAGFATLALSPLPAVREFGLLSVIGVALTVLASLTFTPALLAVLPRPRRAPAGRAASRLAARLGRFDLAHRRGIFLASGALAVISLAAATRIQVGSQQITKFDADAPVRVQFEHINRALGGAGPMFVVVDAAERDAFRSPAALRELASLDDWLRKQPEVGSATSLADTVKLLNRAFHDGDPAAARIPDSKRLVSQLLFLAEGPGLRGQVDRGYRTALVRLRTTVIDSTDVNALARRIEGRLSSLPEGLTGRVTGAEVVLARGLDDIIRGQTVSLATGLLLIYAVLSALFLSLRVGLVALLPNALPVLVYFGALGFTGVLLSPGTSLIAPMVIGIAVDDTIHYFARFIREARRLGDEREATVTTLASVGRPVTVTSVALVLGFCCLVMSRFHTQAELGLLAAFSLGFAWLADVTLTPALCARLRVVTLWDYLALDLGEDPSRSLRLFEGMRPSQARLVALLGSMVEAPAGARLFHAGEPGDGLYVVIEGRVRAWSPRDGVERAVERGRGDTIGAIGFFHGTYAHHAVTLEPTRLLRISGDCTDTLRRRYPRVAAALFHNLNRLLAERFAVQAAGEVLEAGLPEAVHAQSGDATRSFEELVGEELAAELAGLGIRAGTAAALSLVPLVEVAWADGRLDARERAAILESAETLGITGDGASHELLRSWLEQRPSEELLRSWEAFIRSLDEHLTVEGRHRLRSLVLDRARSVAAAAGGLLGLASVSRAEEVVLARLAATFEPPGSRGGPPRASSPGPRGRA